MADLDRTRLVYALSYLVIAAFLLTGVVSMRYRRAFRGTAIVLYLAVLAFVLAAIVLWLAGYPA